MKELSVITGAMHGYWIEPYGLNSMGVAYFWEENGLL